MKLNYLETNVKMEAPINQSKTHREHINPDVLTGDKPTRQRVQYKGREALLTALRRDTTQKSNFRSSHC